MRYEYLSPSFLPFCARSHSPDVCRPVSSIQSVLGNALGKPKLAGEPGNRTQRGTFSMRAFTIIMTLVVSLGWPSETGAYAVLAHEAIIDSIWDTSMRPLLLKRFPGATEAELKEAHG